LSGFSFWSHDIGGFTQATPEELYKRWTPFGMLTSHVRSHGVPPTEPWEFSDEFLDGFRLADEMRYKLMPYIYAQAKECSNNGWPMMRALFVEFPDDAGSWLVDNEYLFGSDILVAPLFESVSSRDVYLPEGYWVDYQTGVEYSGGWHHIEADKIPIIMLVKKGSVIPQVKVAQSTDFIDWKNITLLVYGDEATGLIYLPDSKDVRSIEVKNDKVINDPYQGKVKWNVKPLDK
jgi:alpha-D-xyloside xylohydrolase